MFLKININSRQINDEIFNQTINGFSLEEIPKNKKYLPKHFYNDSMGKIKIFLLNSNLYGRGPQDKMAASSKEINKILINLKKKLKFK